MERQQIKSLFNSMEENTMKMGEMLDFLEILCGDEIVTETGRFLSIIVEQLQAKCERLDIEREQLKMSYYKFL